MKPNAPPAGAVPVSDAMLREIAAFLYLEARLADESRYAEWEALVTDDMHYWVPKGAADYDPTARLSYINDNRARLATRIRQLQTGLRHAQTAVDIRGLLSSQRAESEWQHKSRLREVANHRLLMIDHNSAGIFVDVLQGDPQNRPVSAEREQVRPLNNDDGIFGKQILEAKGLQVMEARNSIQIDVIDLGATVVFVDQRECRAGDLFLACRTEAADNAFRQCRFARAEFALEQNQQRRSRTSADFAPTSHGDSSIGHTTQVVREWRWRSGETSCRFPGNGDHGGREVRPVSMMTK